MLTTIYSSFSNLAACKTSTFYNRMLRLFPVDIIRLIYLEIHIIRVKELNHQYTNKVFYDDCLQCTGVRRIYGNTLTYNWRPAYTKNPWIYDSMGGTIDRLPPYYI